MNHKFVGIAMTTLLLFGCASSPPRQNICSVLTPGMSYADVRQLLGEPATDSTTSGTASQRTVTRNEVTADGPMDYTGESHDLFGGKHREIALSAIFRDDHLIRVKHCSDSLPTTRPANGKGG